MKEKQENQEKDKNQKIKKSKKKVIIIILAVLAIISLAVGILFIVTKNNNTKPKTKTAEVTPPAKKTAYRISGNSLEAFDLYFLQLENNGKDTVYSPLSIKYALEMLGEGAQGKSKTQIDNVVGDYIPKSYPNNANMSFANAMFIQNNYKDSVKETYINNLKSKYNAEVIYDSFATADNINNWVSNKTFNLVNNLVDDVSDKNFVLLNALAIDMEWKNVIKPKTEGYRVHYLHENFWTSVSSLEDSGYQNIKFDNNSKEAKIVDVAAEANKYDIVNTLGEDNIRATVGEKYNEWLAQGACGSPESEPDVNTYLDQYIKDINSNYNHISSSTDFSFYDDENVKVFAKELKEYDGTTLEYVGIMPKEKTLKEYIKNIDAKTVNNIIDNLKDIKMESFKDGVVTDIRGFIPLFKTDYQLKLMKDLKSLGITDIFDITKANLSGITPTKDLYIDNAVHKANIEFSNEGIKAAAATRMYGKGSAGCSFDYSYDVPTEKIDLTFDKPYLYLVRDKNSGEVWFTGTVYNPIFK